MNTRDFTSSRVNREPDDIDSSVPDFSSPFASKAVVFRHTLDALPLTKNETLKRLPSLPIIVQKTKEKRKLNELGWQELEVNKSRQTSCSIFFFFFLPFFSHSSPSFSFSPSSFLPLSFSPCPSSFIPPHPSFSLSAT